MTNRPDDETGDESQIQTRYDKRGTNKGWAAPIHRRQIRDYFGNHFFGSVAIVEPYFQGFDHFGAKSIRWSGVPVASVYFRRHLTNEEYPPIARPSLDVYPVRAELLADEEWPDVRPLFDTIRAEWQAWAEVPDTARLQRWIILFTVEDGELRTFRTPH